MCTELFTLLADPQLCDHWCASVCQGVSPRGLTFGLTGCEPETRQQIADRLAAESPTKARAERAAATQYLAPSTLNSPTRNGASTVTTDYTFT
jgi:hypothetical protein